MSHSGVDRPIVAERLPLMLRAYRLLTMGAAPFANLLLTHRLKRGKEHGERLPERRGESTVARPDGPLVWVHGASVGEIASTMHALRKVERAYARSGA